MKNVAVWNIVLRPTVTQLIFSFSPFAQIIQFHENMMWNSNGNTFLLKISFYFVCKTICVHTYISVLCRLLGKEPLKKNDWSSFHLGSCRCNLYTFKYTVYPTPDTTLYLYYILQYNYTKTEILANVLAAH